MSDAATEATLRELLRSSKDMSGVIRGMAQKMGADVSGITEISNEGGKTAGALKKIAGVVGETILQLNDFGRTAASSGIGVSDLFDRLAGLIPAGKFELLRSGLEAVSSLTKEFEKNSQIYNNLSQIGVTFGGTLANVATVSGKAYMTMDQFAKVASSNADVFRMMGGTVETGMNKFVAIQNSLLDQESPFARNLAALTGGAAGTADALAGFMRTQVSMNKAEFQNIEVIKQGTLDYAKELDGLSKITGKRREQIEQEYQKTAAEESFQQFLSSLDPKEAALAAAKVRALAVTAGEDAAMQMRQAIQTGIISPMTAKQGELNVITGHAITAMVGNLLQAKSAAEIQELTIDGLKTAGTNLNKFAIENKEALAANASVNQGITLAGTRVIRETSNAFKTIEGTSKIIAKINEEQGDQAKGSATSLTLAEQSIAAVAAKINEIRGNILDPVVATITKITKGLGDTVSTVFDATEVKKYSEMIKKGYTNIEESIKNSDVVKILKDNIADFYKNPLTYIKDKSSEAVDSTYDYLSTVLSTHFTAIGTMLSTNLSKLFEMLPGIDTLDKKIKTKEVEIKKVETEIGKTSTETLPEQRSKLDEDLKKLKDEMETLKKELETRKLSGYSEFLAKAIKESSPPKPPTTTTPKIKQVTDIPYNELVSPEELSSANTQGNRYENLPSAEKYASAEQVDKLITSNKELSEILNKKLTELITVARASNETSSKTVMAIRRLNNDGFGMASA